MRHVTITVLTCLTAVQATSAQSIRRHALPTGSVDFAYRQLENGVTGDIVFLGKLTCAAKGCTMVTVSFFPCKSGERNVFLDHKSTWNGDLQVTSTRTKQSATILADESVAGANIQYRFTVALQNDNLISKLIAFTGAAMKTRTLTGGAAAWTLEYLPATASMLESCGTQLVYEPLQ